MLPDKLSHFNELRLIESLSNLSFRQIFNILITSKLTVIKNCLGASHINKLQAIFRNHNKNQLIWFVSKVNHFSIARPPLSIQKTGTLQSQLFRSPTQLLHTIFFKKSSAINRSYLDILIFQLLLRTCAQHNLLR